MRDYKDIECGDSDFTLTNVLGGFCALGCIVMIFLIGVIL